jgi:hypothetical protein
MTQLAPAPVTQPNSTRRSAKGSVFLKMLDAREGHEEG